MHHVWYPHVVEMLKPLTRDIKMKDEYTHHTELCLTENKNYTFNKSILPSFINSKKWSEVLSHINSHPSSLRFWDDEGNLPIHSACRHPFIPISIISTIIEYYPQCLKEPTKSFSLLPLHIACRSYDSNERKNSDDVVKFILKSFVAAASVKDYGGSTPLHSHLSFCLNPSLMVVKLLLEAYSGGVCITDTVKWYPLHYAARRGSWEIAKYLIDLYPDALIAKTSSDLTPRDVANANVNVELRDKLREEEERRFADTCVKEITLSSEKEFKQKDSAESAIS